MAFSTKPWYNFPNTSTPLSAANLNDMETRVTDYAALLDGSVNVKDYGALGNGTADDTTAITDALDVANNNKKSLFFPPGVYTYLPTAGVASGKFPITSSITVWGLGWESTIIKCRPISKSASTYRAFTITGNGSEHLYVGFYNLTLQGADDMSSDDSGDGTNHRNLTAVILLDGGEITATVKNCHFFRNSYAFRYSGTSTTEKHSMLMHNCLVDGDEMGLTSGEKAHPVMGIGGFDAHDTVVSNTIFRNLGTDYGTAGNHSHCLYMYDDAPLTVSNCVFYNHTDGRHIQSFGGADITPNSLGWRINNCHFGYHNPSAAEDNVSCHTQIGYHTQFNNCSWDMNNMTKALQIKGDAQFNNCYFNGTSSVYALDYTDSQADDSVSEYNGCVFAGNASDYFRVSRQNCKIFIRNSRFKLTSTSDAVFFTAGSNRQHQGGELYVSDCYIDINGDFVAMNDVDNWTSDLITDGGTLTRSGTTATLDLNGNDHGLAVGDHVVIEGANQAPYNGDFRVATVPASDQLTYTMASDPGATATGTISAGAKLDYERVDIRDCYFNVGGDVIEQVEGTYQSGTLKDLRLRDNEFGTGTLAKNGEIYSEVSQGNIGYSQPAPLTPTINSVGTFVSTTGAAPKSLNVPYPATIDEGDLILIYAGNQASGSTDPDTPAGWLVAGEGQEGSVGGVRLFYKFADGTETGNVTLNYDLVGNTVGGQMVAISNIAPTDNPFDVAPEADIYQHDVAGDQTPLAMTEIATGTPNAIVIGGGTHRGLQFTTVTQTNMTAISVNFATDSADLNHFWFYEVRPTPGALYSDLDFTTTDGSSAAYGTWRIAFKAKQQ
jgi:hypothetical protein